MRKNLALVLLAQAALLQALAELLLKFGLGGVFLQDLGGDRERGERQNHQEYRDQSQYHWRESSFSAEGRLHCFLLQGMERESSLIPTRP